jgi:hypothetical protein
MKLIDPWCEFNDMPASGCSHCLGTPELDVIQKPELGPIVIARFNGTCAVCNKEIKADEDHIGRIMDDREEWQPWERKWAHYGCGR